MNVTIQTSRLEPSVLLLNRLVLTSEYIYAIAFPVIFVFGIIGNLFSSIIFSVTKLNRTSCGIYFLLLAIYDSIALIAGLHHCLTIGYRVSIPNGIYCRIRNFLLYMSMDMASWMIVAISVDRSLKAKYPIKARIYSTRQLAIIVSSILTFIFTIKNAHLLTIFIGDYTIDAADNCDPNPDYPRYVFFFKNVWPWIDLTTYALLPFILVTISNAFIIYDQYTRRFKKRKRTLDMSFIRLLLVSSISFIVCNLPITILAIIYPYISLSYSTNKLYDNVAFAFDMLRLPAYISLGLNFYLYYYTSLLFRQQAYILIQQLFPTQTNTNDIELINRIYIDRNQTVESLNSYYGSDSIQPLRISLSINSSFSSNPFR